MTVRRDDGHYLIWADADEHSGKLAAGIVADGLITS
jgi:hypothetical protein